MQRRILPVIVLLCAVGAAAFFGWQQSRSRTGYPAPDFALPDLAGATHRLADYRGKVIFLNLWATWCPPCREEMPSMEQLYRRFAASGLVMLAVSEDGTDFSKVEPFVREIGLTFPILLDREGSLPPRYGVTGYPETFIIDREGNIVQHFIGPENWSSPNSIDYFERLLSHTTPGER